MANAPIILVPGWWLGAWAWDEVVDLLREDYKEAIEQGQPWLAGLGELRDLTWIDLPTSHWPMWSAPKELARILGEIAAANGRRSDAARTS